MHNCPVGGLRETLPSLEGNGICGIVPLVPTLRDIEEEDLETRQPRCSVVRSDTRISLGEQKPDQSATPQSDTL